MKTKFFGISLTLSTIIAASTIASSTVVGINNKASAAVSNFYKNCNEILIDENNFSANCQIIKGSVTQSHIVLRGIEHIDDSLGRTSPNQISNDPLTCKNVRTHRGNVPKNSLSEERLYTSPHCDYFKWDRKY